MLFDGPEEAETTLLLAHGAGAPMDMPFLTDFAQGLAARGIRVARFEFAYMAQRRRGGARRPPPKVALLVDEFRAAMAALPPGRLVIGGKSMGGRVAAMTGGAPVLCLGYPFHPQGKPDRLRLEPLQGDGPPVLVVQGSRDPFGTRDEVAGYALDARVRLHWLEDGNHDFTPRRSVTGRGQGDLIAAAVDAACGWIAAL